MLRWSGDGEPLGPVQTTLFNPPQVKPGTEPPPPVYITEIHWFPAAPGKGQTGADVYVVGGTDGT